MSKVRRIDWSPDEWIAGTAGLLTKDQAAVYMAALMVIYSRGGECPNDPVYIGRFFKSELPVRASRQQRAAATMVIRRALDRLMNLGKLQLSQDSQMLTNGRANAELTKAQHRIESAINAGFASGRQRANRDPTASQPAANLHPMRSTPRKNNDLARTRARNHQPSTTISSLSESLTDAARDPAPDQTAPARAPSSVPGPDPFAHTKPAPLASPKTVDRLSALAAKARARFVNGE